MDETITTNQKLFRTVVHFSFDMISLPIFPDPINLISPNDRPVLAPVCLWWTFRNKLQQASRIFYQLFLHVNLILGHLVCSECQPSLIRCPICDIKYRSCLTRDFFAEKLLEHLERKCRFQHFGCDQSFKDSSRLVEHESFCDFKPELPVVRNRLGHKGYF